MKTFRRSILAFLMAFSLLGLAACDGNGDDLGAGDNGALEEPIEPGEPLE